LQKYNAPVTESSQLYPTEFFFIHNITGNSCQNISYHGYIKTTSMKNLRMLFLLVLMSTVLTSCEAIAGIFKAGMGFGIFLVIAVIALIAFFVMRAGKK
jgi:hypothetical protein